MTLPAARCKDQASGSWYVRKVTHTKAANLKLINTMRWQKCLSTATGFRRWAKTTPTAVRRRLAPFRSELQNGELQFAA